MRKVALGLLAGAAVMFIAAKPAHAAELPTTPTETKEQKHTVAEGEHLSKIATQYKLESWRPIWNVNPTLSDPDIVHPGQQLTIPSGPTQDRPLPAAPAPVVKTSSAPQQARQYKPRAVYAQGAGGIMERIKMRESGGNYAAVSPSGKYRGAYQFDYATWRSVGGSGDPAAASPAEQDMRAQLLYQQRGCSPWPNTCY